MSSASELTYQIISGGKNIKIEIKKTDWKKKNKRINSQGETINM